MIEIIVSLYLSSKMDYSYVIILMKCRLDKFSGLEIHFITVDMRQPWGF
jgi:hypothetical protein